MDFSDSAQSRFDAYMQKLLEAGAKIDMQKEVQKKTTDPPAEDLDFELPEINGQKKPAEKKVETEITEATEVHEDPTMFWDFSNTPQFIGMLNGQGKTIHFKETKETVAGDIATWSFKDKASGNTWLIPQWPDLDSLRNDEPGKKIYQIHYVGMDQLNKPQIRLFSKEIIS